jgi:hypothetical protein
MKLFTKSCECGGFILGPRLGGKARGQWLGYDECLDCREKASAEPPAHPINPGCKEGGNS